MNKKIMNIRSVPHKKIYIRPVSDGYNLYNNQAIFRKFTLFLEGNIVGQQHKIVVIGYAV